MVFGLATCYMLILLHNFVVVSQQLFGSGCFSLVYGSSLRSIGRILVTSKSIYTHEHSDGVTAMLSGDTCIMRKCTKVFVTC
jgi:hypothetical protein